MPNEILVKNGTPVVWADATDYSSTGSGYTRTHQLALASIANDAAREGAKADLGATRAARYSVRVGIEWGTAPTAGNLVEIYWSASTSATAATGNDGGASGSDGGYKVGEVDEWKKQLIPIGPFIATNDAAGTVQRMTVGIFSPPERYGMPVVVNKSGQAFDSDDIQMYVALIPLVDEIQ